MREFELVTLTPFLGPVHHGKDRLDACVRERADAERTPRQVRSSSFEERKRIANKRDNDPDVGYPPRALPFA